MTSVEKVNKLLQKYSKICAKLQHNWTVETASNCPPGYFVARLAVPDPLTEGSTIIFVGKSALGKKAAKQNVAVQALQWLEHTHSPLQFLDEKPSELQSEQVDRAVLQSGSAEAPSTLELKQEPVNNDGATSQDDSVLHHSSTLQDIAGTSYMGQAEEATGCNINYPPDKNELLKSSCLMFGIEYSGSSTTFRSVLHNIIQKRWKLLANAPSPAIVWNVSYVTSATSAGYVATLHLDFTENNSQSVQRHQLPPQSFTFSGSPAINKRLALENVSMQAVSQLIHDIPVEQINYGAKQRLNIFLQKTLRPTGGQSVCSYLIDRQPSQRLATELRCTIAINPLFMSDKSMIREVKGDWMATRAKAEEDAASKLLIFFYDGLWSILNGAIISPTIKQSEDQPCFIKRDDVDQCDGA